MGMFAASSPYHSTKRTKELSKTSAWTHTARQERINGPANRDLALVQRAEDKRAAEATSIEAAQAS